MTVTPTIKWTEAVILDALRQTYLPEHDALNTEEWAFLTQVALRCPQPEHVGSKPSYWTTNERTIDALLVRNWSGGRYGHERVAIEVKVSKADYRHETPQKRAPAEASAHRCAYAAPAGMIDPDTLPDGWGLIEVHAATVDGPDRVSFSTKWRTKAIRREPTADLNYLTSAGFRRASRAEERIRRGDSAAAEIVALRAEAESLRGIAERAQQARDREMERAKAARSELLALSGAQECSTCGAALTWKRGGHHDSRWRHKDEGNEWACHNLRREAYEAAQRAHPNLNGFYAPYPSDPTPVAGS